MKYKVVKGRNRDPDRERRLLFRLTSKHFQFKATRGGGPGGQHRNKVHTGVECRHELSESMGRCTEHKSQRQNKYWAWRKCIEEASFKAWLRVEVARAMGKPSLDELVNAMMRPEDMQVEVRDETGKWVPADWDSLRK